MTGVSMVVIILEYGPFLLLEETLGRVAYGAVILHLLISAAFGWVVGGVLPLVYKLLH